MKLLSVFLAAILAASSAFSADLNPKIAGADVAVVNQELRLTVENVATPTLDKAQDWIKKLTFRVNAPAGTEPFEDMELALGSGGLRLKLYFSSSKPGVYVLILVDGNTGALATHRITVTGAVPPADPTPGPGPTTPGPTTPPSDPPTNPPTQPMRVTRVTYVYEKKDPIPPQVISALNTINRSQSGVVCSLFDQDTPSATGAVPWQYKIALEQALKTGLPCLVVQSGDRVYRAIKDPKTSEQVMEAVK